MSERKTVPFSSQNPQTYEIRVGTCLEPSMVEWLGDLTICHAEKTETVLAGIFPDQSALFGMLLRMHNLGIPLISVNPRAGEIDETG